MNTFIQDVIVYLSMLNFSKQFSEIGPLNKLQLVLSVYYNLFRLFIQFCRQQEQLSFLSVVFFSITIIPVKTTEAKLSL